MIDEEKIYEEANGVYDEKFLNDTYGIIYYDNGDEDEAHTPCQVTEAFIMGAQWAQKEFIKSLWHDASEKPKQHKMIVAITGGTDSLTNFDAEVYNFPFTMSKGDWVDLVDQDGIVRWCYFSDLLPKEGGEKWQQ